MMSIDLTKLRNGEYLQFMKDYSDITERNDPATLNLGNRLVNLQGKITEIDGLFKKVLANENTALIQEIDQKRDRCITGLSMVIQGYEYHYDQVIRTAAQRLAANIRLYGSGIARQGYQAETATLNSIIADWEGKPELSAALKTLQLEAWIQEMKTLNIDFGTIYLDRTQEYGDASPETLFKKRLETSTVYYSLRDRIDALHLLVEAPDVSPYTKLINQLNALIDQYNTLLNNRSESGDAPPPTDTDGE